MNTRKSFLKVVEAVLNRHRNTPVVARWEESKPSDEAFEPVAFWIRESADLVNIVWLTGQNIRDISWFPNENRSTFDITRISALTGFEVREEKYAAKKSGCNVEGDYIVDVFVTSTRGGFLWVASNAKEKSTLQDFIKQLEKLMEG